LLPGAAPSQKISENLKHVHADSARELNPLDGKVGRTVWYNFWETKLTYERSYLARLSYVHRNPVKHGLVRMANQYRWCSAAWFERVASPAMVKTIYDFKIDRLTIKTISKDAYKGEATKRQQVAALQKLRAIQFQ
jgi:putative transposase